MPKRMRRAYLKRYSSDYINVTQKPRLLVLDQHDAKKDRDRLFANQQRVKTVVGRKDQMEPVKDNTFMPLERWECPECGDTAYLFFVCKKCRIGGVNPKAVKILSSPIPDTDNRMRARHPKQEVAKTLHKMWQSERFQGADSFICSITFYKHRDWSLKLFHNPKGDTYFLQSEDATMIRRSIFYTKEKAFAKAKGSLKDITWIETILKS